MLDRSGPFYFISGAKGHCEQGQKMIIVVLSGIHTFSGVSPAPSPVEYHGPNAAPSPTSGVSGLRSGVYGSLFLVLGSLLLRYL